MNPNSALYKRYEKGAYRRGRLIANLLAQRTILRDARILDIGCGVGGTSIALAEVGAHVIAVDFRDDLDRLKHLAHQRGLDIETIHSKAEHLNLEATTIDAVILSDVVEHVDNPILVLRKAFTALRDDGWLYLSTPNKYSLLNILCDPHYSLPFVALFKRSTVKRIVAGILHWQPAKKMDFAELLSLPQLAALLQNAGFVCHFVNREVAGAAMSDPQSLWNRTSHLIVVRALNKTGLSAMLLGLVNDRPGFFNTWINPTWFILAQKA